MQGHGVASGVARDPRFPRGTIQSQLPFFETSIPGFEQHLGGPAFPGTLNVALDGAAVSILSPEFHVRDVRWTDAFEPESFFLSAGWLEHAGATHPVLLYIPDPATKPDHFQPGEVIELLARRLPGVGYGDRVRLLYSPAAVTFTPSA